MPESIVRQHHFTVFETQDVCASLSGILPSWDDFIRLPEQKFEIGQIFTVKAVQVADYLLVAPLHAIANLAITIAAKCRRQIVGRTAAVRRVFRLVRPAFKRVLVMRL